MRLRPIAAATALLACSHFAKADTYQLFALNATFLNGAVATGTVNIDLDDGFNSFNQRDSTADIFVQLGQYTAHISGKSVGLGGQQVPSLTEIQFAGTDSSLIGLLFPTAQPGIIAGYSGGALSSESALGFHGGSYIVSGSLTPIASPVPEPSSLALLGTGALGAIGAARRRFAA